jgi:hypothetical protein
LRTSIDRTFRAKISARRKSSIRGILGKIPGVSALPVTTSKYQVRGPEGAAAKIPEKPALELEEDPQHLRDGEDDLAMRHIQEKRLPHPLAPLLDPLGMTRWAKTPGAAREHNEPLLGAVRTLDPGKPATGIAAVKILLDHLLDDQPEKNRTPARNGSYFCQRMVYFTPSPSPLNTQI